MAITTLNDALAGMLPSRDFFKGLTGTMVASRPHSLFYMTGYPGPAVAPTPGLTGEVLTSYAGQIPFSNPVSGNTYLAKFKARATVAGTLVLCDRLWQNSGITITSNTEQTFTSSVQIPARDINGTNNGVGVFAGVEVSSATSTGTPTLTLKYTNSSGSANKTATNIIPTAASSIAGSFYPIGLAAGDVGIQKAQSLTLSATWTSGTIHVVLYRPLAYLDLNVAEVPASIDLLSGSFTRLYDNTVPFLLFYPATTTTSSISGRITYTQG